MRISERLRYETVAGRINDAKEQNSNAMEELSSQRRIEKLSDDPVGSSQIIRFRDQIENVRQFQTNIEYSKGFLERSEEALQAINNNLIRAKELSVAMSNSTYDPASREATSREIREVMDEIITLGNSTFNGRYVFGGFRNQTPTLNLDGDFMGDDGIVHLELSSGNFRPVSLNGRDVFEATPEEVKKGHFNMIESLNLLYNGMSNNDTDSIHRAMNELEHQLDKTSAGIASVGAMSTAINETGARLSGDETTLREQLSKVQDSDMYHASSEFKRTEAVLQGTLMASSKLLQPSLLNFLQ